MFRNTRLLCGRPRKVAGMKNRTPKNPDEIRARSEIRVFARLILPVFEAEYQSQLMSPTPCWTFLAVLERQLRTLEEQAK